MSTAARGEAAQVTAGGPCPCGRRDARQRAHPFARCCGRFLADFERAPAPDAGEI